MAASAMEHSSPDTLDDNHRARIASVLDARQAVEVTTTRIGNVRGNAIWVALPVVDQPDSHGNPGGVRVVTSNSDTGSKRYAALGVAPTRARAEGSRRPRSSASPWWRRAACRCSPAPSSRGAGVTTPSRLPVLLVSVPTACGTCQACL